MPARDRGDRWRDICLALAVPLIGAAVLASTTQVGGRRDTVKALRTDPLDLEALKAAALRLDAGGEPERAEAILDYVLERSRRDGDVDLWLLSRRLDEGRFDKAFEITDAVLRLDGDETVRPQLFAMLRAAAAQPPSRPALIDRLAVNPPWGDAFLQDLARSGDLEAALEVFQRLAKARGVPATLTTINPLLDRLIRAGREAEAFAWVRATKGAAAQDAIAVTATDSTAALSPFDWSGAMGTGVSESFHRGADGQTVMRLDYDGFSTVDLPRRLLLLTPGVYRLAWREAVSALSPPLAWRLSCNGGSDLIPSTVARSSPAADGSRAATLAFTVPGEACRAVWVQMQVPPGERRAPVSIDLRDLALQKAG